MTSTIIIVLILLVYLGALIALFKFISKKVDLNFFQSNNGSLNFIFFLVIPFVLLLPLSNAFYQLNELKDSFELESIDLFAKYSVMISRHFISSAVGTLFLLLFIRIYLVPEDENNSTKLFLGTLLIAVAIAMLLFPFTADFISAIIPKAEIQGFRG